MPDNNFWFVFWLAVSYVVCCSLLNYLFCMWLGVIVFFIVTLKKGAE